MIEMLMGRLYYIFQEENKPLHAWAILGNIKNVKEFQKELCAYLQ